MKPSSCDPYEDVTLSSTSKYMCLSLSLFFISEHKWNPSPSGMLTSLMIMSGSLPELSVFFESDNVPVLAVLDCIHDEDGFPAVEHESLYDTAIKKAGNRVIVC